MMLLIKGTPEQAINACANHALPIDITSIRQLAPSETLVHVDAGFERTVQDWFLEGASQVCPPYPPGTLLHYSDDKASARLVELEEITEAQVEAEPEHCRDCGALTADGISIDERACFFCKGD